MKSFYIIVLSILLTIPILSQEKKKLTTFRFDYNSRNQVYLSGDFNNWNPDSHPMYRKDGKWHLSLELAEGYTYFSYVTKTNIMPDPNYPLIVDNKLNKFMSVIKVGNPEKPKRYNPEAEFPANYLPKLIFEENPSLELIFIHSQKLLFNYFYSFFTWNENSEKNHSPLFSLSAGYFRDVIPVGKFLDTFYETEYEIYHISENAVNCAFLPYCEFRYFQITGDDSRFKFILPKLLRKYELLFKYVQNEIKFPKTSFDPHNLNQIKYSPLFLKSIQALYIKYVALIAGIIEDEKTGSLFVSKYVDLSENINSRYLKKNLSYFDKWENGKSSDDFHSGFLSAILAEVCPKYSLKSVKMTFSKEDYFYPIFNYLYCCGLKAYQENKEAEILANETVLKIIDSFNNFVPNEAYLNLNEKYSDGYASFWNSYSTVINSPMLFDNSQQYALQDDLLTAGPGFFNMTLEHFMSIELAGNENLIRWKPNGEKKQGVKNLKFRDQKIDLMINKNQGTWYLDIKCKKSFDLQLTIDDKIFTRKISPGYNSIVLE